MSKSLRALAFLPLLLAAPALAQEETLPVDPEALTDDTVTIGAGLAVMPSYEGSDDYRIMPLPGVRGRVSGIAFALRGNRFWADVVPMRTPTGWDIQAGPILSLNMNRAGGFTDPQVELVGTRPPALEAGGFLGLGYQGLITSDYDKLSVNVAFVHDVTGVHRSYVITPTIDYGTPLSRTAYAGISFSANYAGEGYADAYFNVNPFASAATGLPRFDARGGWKDWTAGGVGMISLTGDLTGGLALIGGVSYRRMLGDFAASPLTSVAGSRHQWSGALGLAYTF